MRSVLVLLFGVLCRSCYLFTGIALGRDDSILVGVPGVFVSGRLRLLWGCLCFFYAIVKICGIIERMSRWE